MGLVDYSSSSSDDSGSEGEAAPEPPAKRQKRKPLDDSGAVSAVSGSGMPPLPPAFHDLYASTVRQSVVDDPTLHQGRKRQIPHVVGNWPTHLYIEWHPTMMQHEKLVELVKKVDEALGSKVDLHNFLTSDLGAPLPLHISLSRPMALSTANKDQFLDKVSSTVGSCGISQFAVSPQNLVWYRSPDSNRTFLILRVASKAGEDAKFSPNPELMALLRVCNESAAFFDQPVLYQQNKDELADEAFHVSIGWTFGLPVDEASIKALDPFEKKEFQHIRTWKIEVSGVKAKIGNAVSHIPLATEGKRGPHSKRPSSSLFGL